MTEEQIIGFIVQGGIGVIFGILYLRLWADYKSLQDKYLEDLRDIAGIRAQLRRADSRLDDTRPLPDLSNSGAD